MSENAAVPPPQPSDDRPPAVSLTKFGIELLAIVLVIAFVGTMFLRRPIQSSACKAHLKKIGLALHAYHEKYDSFPPAYVLGPDEQPWHSWRVLLLPFLGQEELYQQYRFDEPWDGPHNKTLHARIPEVYACGARQSRDVTTYLAVVGRATVWPEQYGARLADVGDDPNLTISLFEVVDSNVIWLEPRDLTYRQAMKYDQPTEKLRPSSAPHDTEMIQVLMVDGATRKISAKLYRDHFRNLLSINSGAPFPGVNWPMESLPETPELAEPQAAEKFPGTEITPYPDTPLVGGKNTVYCATFEIAWDQACQKFGRPLRLEGNPPLAQALNGHQFQRTNLDPNSYTTKIGQGDAEFRQQLAQELKSRFPTSRPTLVNPDGRDHELQLYAYLLKVLPFQVEFDELPEPVSFQAKGQTIRVASFGAMHVGADSHSDQMITQVTILDYRHDNDFVVRLIPGGIRDQIILAKVPPQTTLQATVDAVQKRIKHPDPKHIDQHFLASETLAIPNLTFSILRNYSELTGRNFVEGDLYLSLAMQVIKFRLDHTGAVLESEAVIGADNGHEPQMPAGKRRFIFDRPFLIYLIERDADQPYFAAWIENAEFMTRFSPPK